MWLFGKNKSKSDDSDNTNKDSDELRIEEYGKIIDSVQEEIKQEKEMKAKMANAPKAEPAPAPAPVEVKKEEPQAATQASNLPKNDGTFCFGIEGKILLGDETALIGYVRGTVKDGDEVCFINVDEAALDNDEEVTLAIANVSKAKIKRIEAGNDRHIVGTVSDDRAVLYIENVTDYNVKVGSVLCSEKTKVFYARAAYFQGIGNGYIVSKQMDITDEDYASMSLNDMAELVRLFPEISKHVPALNTEEFKKTISGILDKLAKNIAKRITEEKTIYVLFSTKTGEPKMFSQHFDRPDGQIQIQPPVILIATESMGAEFKKAYANDPLVEVRKFEAGEDGKGIYNFLGTVFYSNGANGVFMTYRGLVIPAEYIVPKPDFSGVPAVQVPVTNPLVESLILLNGQMEKIESEEEQKTYKIQSVLLFQALAKAKFIVPMKIEGEVENLGDNKAVIKKQSKIAVPTIQGKDGRPAVKMFTDWKRMLEAGFNPKDDWSANIVTIESMIGQLDCLINATTSERTSAAIYVSKDMYDSQIKKYVDANKEQEK